MRRLQMRDATVANARCYSRGREMRQSRMRDAAFANARCYSRAPLFNKNGLQTELFSHLEPISTNKLSHKKPFNDKRPHLMGSILDFFTFWSPSRIQSEENICKQSKKIGSKKAFFLIWSPFSAKIAHFSAESPLFPRAKRHTSQARSRLGGRDDGDGGLCLSPQSTLAAKPPHSPRRRRTTNLAPQAPNFP